MSTLIVTLPDRATDAASYRFALTADGRHIDQEGLAPLALLPTAGRSPGDLVVVVPPQRLSWHSAELPKGTSPRSPRLRAVLDGLLEDRLLDDTPLLHFALSPAARAGAPAWVAVCDRAWLRDALLALEATQRPLVRVVPEFWPSPDTADVLHVIGEADDALLVHEGGDGVQCWPLNSAGVALAQGTGALNETTTLVAEPAVAGLAEQFLRRQADLRTPAQRALRAAQSPWDLLQFDLASSGRSRALKRLQGDWQTWLRAPQWRAVRWGAAALLAVNVVGINALAWQERSALAQKRQQVRNVLTQTFPATRVVVDAPVQMEREVALLRQAAGATSGGDLESVLNVLASALPPGRIVSGVDFAAGETRLRGLELGAAELDNLSDRLRGQGYLARTEGATVVVRPTPVATAATDRNGGRP